MFELLNEQLVPLEDLQAERCLMLCLEALEQRGVTPTYAHYGIEQHFDLEWRRCRTYPPRTRLPSEDAGKHEDEEKIDNRPSWGMSRTRAHMYHRSGSGASSSSQVQPLGIEGREHKESEDDDSEVWIDDGEDDSDGSGVRRPAAADTRVVAVEVQEVDPPPMASAVVLQSRAFYPLQLNSAEGTSL